MALGQGLILPPPNKGVALDRAGMTVLRYMTFLAAGPASELCRYTCWRLPMRRVLSLIVCCFLAVGCTETPPEFQRSGNPALKLEVRRAATKKVDGWKPMTTPRFYYSPRWRPAREEVNPWKPSPDDRQGTETCYVSPEVELSNEDVLSTGVYFTPMLPKAGSRWKWGAIVLVWSVACFVFAWWRRKDKGMWWGWGVSGLVSLLLGLGILWYGLTSTRDWFYQRGIWQVVIRFNDAGKKKLALLAASTVDAKNEQSNWYPSKDVVFLIDGEMNFVAPPHLALQSLGIPHKMTAIALQHHHSTHLHPDEQDAEEVYYVYQVGLTEEDATRIAKGIVGP